MYRFLFSFLNFLASLPFSFLYFISDILFFLLYYVVKYRKKIVKQNLINSFPNKSINEIEMIQKEFYRHFCDLIIESVKSVGMTSNDFLTRYKVKNMDMLFEYSQNKQSVILLSSHHSNWEWVCFFPSVLKEHFKVLAVYQPLSNKNFDAYIKETRQKHSGELIAMKETFKAVLAAAQNKEVTMTWMAADQSPSKEAGIWFNFLNQDTAFFGGYEKIAKKTNQPVIFVDVKKVGRGYYEIELILISKQVQEMQDNFIVQKYSQLTENQILRQPAYWLWSHNRWKHQRT